MKTFINRIIVQHIKIYPLSPALFYFWNFGSLAGLCLISQILSGLFLAMYYVPNTEMAAASVEYIMRDVPGGWWVRYLHSNGASIFFFVLYGHIARGLYYRSYTTVPAVWYSGMVIYLLVMATAFLGYVLPWGQMSYWGATVITNFFSAIPWCGKKIALWLWGGYTVGNATLGRFFSLHFFLPFLVIGVVIIHLALLHVDGSTTPLIFKNRSADIVTFYPYFFLKDGVSYIILLMVTTILVHFAPNWLGHPDNFIDANPMSTPAHIVPEWYFLPFYAILRSIPNKVGGIVCMGLAIVVLFCMPLIDRNKHVPKEIIGTNTLWRFLFGNFIGVVLLLLVIGSKPVIEPWILIGQISTFYYFLHLCVITPLVARSS